MMVTYVPDDAPVRAKMLQASSRAGLLKALGASNFKHDWFATSIKDLTPSALTAHLNHLSSPPPLSASEAALAEVREAEAEEAKRTALDPEAEARRKRAIAGLGGKFSWGDGVADALDKCSKRSDEGWIVVLEIPASNPAAVTLLTSEACTPSQLASKLPAKSPAYTFYSYPTPPPPATSTPTAKSTPASSRNTFQASEGGVRSVATNWTPKNSGDAEGASEAKTDEPKGEDDLAASDLKIDEPESIKVEGKGRVLFIYTCPSGSPIKFRMVYSSGVRGIQQDAIDKAGIEIAAKLETSDISDLTESHLKSSIPASKPNHSSSLPAPSGLGGFGRPHPTIGTGPIRSATQTPLPASGPNTPITPAQDGEEDSKDSIRKAFDAFGPRVNAGSGASGGFARPKPAGRR